MNGTNKPGKWLILRNLLVTLSVNYGRNWFVNSTPDAGRPRQRPAHPQAAAARSAAAAFRPQPGAAEAASHRRVTRPQWKQLRSVTPETSQRELLTEVGYSQVLYPDGKFHNWNQSNGFWIYNYVQRQRCNTYAKAFLIVEEFFFKTL
jgi:hypothetical protein